MMLLALIFYADIELESILSEDIVPDVICDALIFIPYIFPSVPTLHTAFPDELYVVNPLVSITVLLYLLISV